LISGEQAGANGQGPGAGGATGKQYRARSEGEQGGGGGAAGAAETRTPRVDVAVVWKLRPDKTQEPVKIRTGITDHTLTEVVQVLNGELKEGEELVTGAISKSAGARPPGMGGTTTPRR